MHRWIIGLFVLVFGFSNLSAAEAGRNDIHASAQDVQPLLAGMQAPVFTVRDVNNDIFR